MPITFLLDADLGVVRTTYSGMIGLADLAHYVYLLSQRDWLRMPQLIDGRQARLALAPGDAGSLGVSFVRAARQRLQALLPRLSVEEREAHARFVAGDLEGDVIWSWGG